MFKFGCWEMQELTPSHNQTPRSHLQAQHLFTLIARLKRGQRHDLPALTCPHGGLVDLAAAPRLLQEQMGLDILSR